MTKVPVTVLSGFLGAGKTTVLNNLLNNRDGLRLAVVVNDMSEVNIDADLVRGGDAAVSLTEESLVEMTNGCICCTLRDDLLNELRRLAEMGRFDAIVVESTGIAEPLPVAATFDFRDESGLRLGDVAILDTMVTVVDAVNFVSDFASCDTLLDRGERRDDSDMRSLSELLVDQVEFADLIVLNKVSDAGRRRVVETLRLLRSLNSGARIVEADYGRLPLDDLLRTGLFDFEKARKNSMWFRELHGFANHQPESEEYGIESVVFRARAAFDPSRLHRVLTGSLPGVIRGKGFFWIATQPSWAMEYSLTGAVSKFKPFGRWWAATPRSAWPAHGTNALDRIKREWRQSYGDRRQELVFIGRQLDRDRISRMLESCLVHGRLDSQPYLRTAIRDPFSHSQSEMA